MSHKGAVDVWSMRRDAPKQGLQGEWAGRRGGNKIAGLDWQCCFDWVAERHDEKVDVLVEGGLIMPGRGRRGNIAEGEADVAAPCCVPMAR